jgi:quercetin dioxygenase-like cupin family protein
MATTTHNQPYHLSAGHARNLNIFGSDHLMLATGAQTGGLFAQFQNIVPPQGGPMPHVHSREDETFYILEGLFEFRVGGQVILAEAGDFVYAPRLIPHVFRNVGSQTGQMLVTVTPAGLEEFFAESIQILKENPHDMDAVIALGKRYEMELVTSDRV